MKASEIARNISWVESNVQDQSSRLTAISGLQDMLETRQVLIEKDFTKETDEHCLMEKFFNCEDL